MSEFKNCPVCGANDWEVIFDYYCKNCKTTISIENINRRVLDWVPVNKRLPERGGVYFVKAKKETDDHLYGTVAIYDTKNEDFLYTPWCVVVEWLDDHTWEKRNG